jgi:preprotein translocase subunit SecG
MSPAVLGIVAFCALVLCIICMLAAIRSDGFRAVMSQGGSPTQSQESWTLACYWAAWFFIIVFFITLVAACSVRQGVSL